MRYDGDSWVDVRADGGIARSAQPGTARGLPGMMIKRSQLFGVLRQQ